VWYDLKPSNFIMFSSFPETKDDCASSAAVHGPARTGTAAGRLVAEVSPLNNLEVVHLCVDHTVTPEVRRRKAGWYELWQNETADTYVVKATDLYSIYLKESAVDFTKVSCTAKFAAPTVAETLKLVNTHATRAVVKQVPKGEVVPDSSSMRPLKVQRGEFRNTSEESLNEVKVGGYNTYEAKSSHMVWSLGAAMLQLLDPSYRNIATYFGLSDANQVLQLLCQEDQIVHSLCQCYSNAHNLQDLMYIYIDDVVASACCIMQSTDSTGCDEFNAGKNNLTVVVEHVAEALKVLLRGSLCVCDADRVAVSNCLKQLQSTKTLLESALQTS
jgi:hypothetical protein